MLHREVRRAIETAMEELLLAEKDRLPRSTHAKTIIQGLRESGLDGPPINATDRPYLSLRVAHDETGFISKAIFEQLIASGAIPTTLRDYMTAWGRIDQGPTVNRDLIKEMIDCAARIFFTKLDTYRDRTIKARSIVSYA